MTNYPVVWKDDYDDTLNNIRVCLQAEFDCKQRIAELKDEIAQVRAHQADCQKDLINLVIKADLRGVIRIDYHKLTEVLNPEIAIDNDYRRMRAKIANYQRMIDELERECKAYSKR